MDQNYKISTSSASNEALAPEILMILSDVYGQSPWTLAQIQADLSQPFSEYFYLYHHEELIGFLALQDLAGELEITQIAIKRLYQGKGFASQLMEGLENRGESIFLEVRASNKRAQHLYEKYGFQKVGLRKQYYHQPEEDAIVMVREGKVNN